jgi:hypothetical protein
VEQDVTGSTESDVCRSLTKDCHGASGWFYASIGSARCKQSDLNLVCGSGSSSISGRGHCFDLSLAGQDQSTLSRAVARFCDVLVGTARPGIGHAGHEGDGASVGDAIADALSITGTGTLLDLCGANQTQRALFSYSAERSRRFSSG